MSLSVEEIARYQRHLSLAGFGPAAQEKLKAGSVLVVVGGVEFSADGTLIDDRRTTEVFDPDTGRWTMLDALLPTGRGSLDCAVEPGSTVIAIGGGTRTGPGSSFVSVPNVDALSIKTRDLREH